MAHARQRRPLRRNDDPGSPGTQMWKLTIEDDQASKTVVHLVRDEYTVGRAEENTIRLTERNISRQHARLGKTGERWFLFDLRSYNGCYVNGQRVNGQHELAHGDLVQVGDYRLQAMDEAIADPAATAGKATLPAAPRSQALLGQPDRLVMVVGPTVGAEFPLSHQQPVVLGRGEECDVPINHPSVSRVHAEIHGLGDGRYEIVDRESANGVRVNGHELSRSLIDARDAIELGDVILKFIPEGDIYVPGADESMQIAALALGKPASSGGLPMSVKIGAVIGAVAIVTALGVAVATRKGFTPELASSAGEAPIDSATRVLNEAKALLDQGDPAAAARKANELPEDSNARKSAIFRQIEAAWADSLLAQANASNDPAQKRALLDQIARSTNVDSLRRNRAANDLAALNAGSVDVADLPSASKPAATGAHPAVASAGGRPATPPEPAAAPEPKPKPPGTQPAPNKANAPATLVRKNPFD